MRAGRQQEKAAVGACRRRQAISGSGGGDSPGRDGRDGQPKEEDSHVSQHGENGEYHQVETRVS